MIKDISKFKNKLDLGLDSFFTKFHYYEKN